MKFIDTHLALFQSKYLAKVSINFIFREIRKVKKHPLNREIGHDADKRVTTVIRKNLLRIDTRFFKLLKSYSIFTVHCIASISPERIPERRESVSFRMFFFSNGVESILFTQDTFYSFPVQK